MFKFKTRETEDQEEKDSQVIHILIENIFNIIIEFVNNYQPISKYFKPRQQSEVTKTLEQPIASTSSTTSEDQISSQNKNTVNKFDAKSSESVVEEVSGNRRPVIFGNTLLVNCNQSGNKLLKHLRIPYQMTDSISPAHYLMFDSCCAIFLSLKYHVIYPDYIYEKLNELRNAYQLKVLLLLVDHIEFQSSLKELTKLSIRTNCTLVLSWSYEEAANHIENYRNFADKSADIIMGKQTNNSEANQTAYQCIIEALTSVKSINKTDAVSLISTFDSFENIVKSDDDQLIVCPGMAALKVSPIRHKNSQLINLFQFNQRLNDCVNYCENHL